MPPLCELREKIDKTDDELLRLFLERMTLCGEVAKCKAADAMPVQDRTREREILARVHGKSGELDRYSHRLFSGLLELSRAYQDTLCGQPSPIRGTVEEALSKTPGPFPQTGAMACQGVEGAYSQMAAA
ncbi:MAG TPA: bifunctional chorismate mutase/prephenate dehydratase, partial [Clostridiales bacterium]|nr:bifunctional chorismate mutase/prephenate dehydratase [Clostridiales bacterium]